MPFRRPWAYERGTLWAMELVDAPSPAPASSPAGVTFDEVLPGDAAPLAAVMGLPDPQAVSERFAHGRRCFVARIAGAIAAYGWASTGTERIGELERTIRMLPGEVYIWDCATLPAFRRRGLYGALLRHMVSVLRGEGARRLWIGASRDNAPSIRGFRSAGFRPVIRLVYLRVLGVRRIWLKGDETAPPALVAAARRALTGGRELPQGAGAISVAAPAPVRDYGAEEP